MREEVATLIFGTNEEISEKLKMLEEERERVVKEAGDSGD